MNNDKYKEHEERHTEYWSKFWNGYSPTKGENVLDFGCGTGLCVKMAKEIQDLNITGIDIDQRKTNNDDTFKKFHKKYSVEENIIFYDGLKLPFQPNHFNVIICCSSLLQDNTEEIVNLNIGNKNKLKKRIKELIRVSARNAIWIIAPYKDWIVVCNYFKRHNTKQIKYIDMKRFVKAGAENL